MADAVNPYESPKSEAAPEDGSGNEGIITETMRFYLKGSAYWLKFLGILGFVWSGLLIIFGLAALGGWVETFFGPIISVLGQSFGPFVVLSIGIGVLIFPPSLFMYTFGTKISVYLETGSDKDLEEAFKNNKSLWKFFGISVIVYLSLILLFVVIDLLALAFYGYHLWEIIFILMAVS